MKKRAFKLGVKAGILALGAWLAYETGKRRYG